MRTALAAAIALIPAIAFAADTIGYGSRAGMEVDVISKAGLDTSHSVIVTRHSLANAIAFCRDYVRKVTPACVHDERAVRLNNRITANCLTGTFVDFEGARYRFAGAMHPGTVMAKYRLIDLATGKAEDGTSASGYSTNMAIFRALCPRHAPPDE